MKFKVLRVPTKQRDDIKPNCYPFMVTCVSLLFIHQMDIFIFSVGHLVRGSNIFCWTFIQNVRLSDEFRQHCVHVHVVHVIDFSVETHGMMYLNQMFVSLVLTVHKSRMLMLPVSSSDLNSQDFCTQRDSNSQLSMECLRPLGHTIVWVMPCLKVIFKHITYIYKFNKWQQ